MLNAETGDNDRLSDRISGPGSNYSLGFHNKHIQMQERLLESFATSFCFYVDFVFLYLGDAQLYLSQVYSKIDVEIIIQLTKLTDPSHVGHFVLFCNLYCFLSGDDNMGKWKV